MKKLSKKITAIVGTTTLVVGLMALPALAGASQQQDNGWFGQMQGFMQRTFSPQQHQALLNSTAMQNIDNSSEMQNAMQRGNVMTQQKSMNSDPIVKAQIGQANLDKMNQFMSKSGESFGGMMSSGSRVTGSQETMNEIRTGSGTRAGVGNENNGGNMMRSGRGSVYQGK